MIISIFLLIVFLLVQIQFRKIKENATQIFPREQTDFARLFCSIVVVLFHCSILISCNLYMSPIKLMGKHMVGVFFFLSGYGTVLHVNSAQELVKKSLKKYEKLGLLYILSNFIYLIVFGADEKHMLSFVTIIFPPANSTLWYIVAVFAFYNLFAASYYVGGKISKENTKIFSVLICSGMIVFITLVLAIIEVQAHWIVSNLALIPGMVAAVYPTKAKEFIYRHTAKILIITMLVGALFETIPKIYMENGILKNLMFTVSVLCCSCFFMVLVQRIPVRTNKMIMRISKCSAELYLFHMIILVYFKQLYEGGILNAESAIFFTVIVSLIVGIIVHEITDTISGKPVRTKWTR